MPEYLVIWKIDFEADTPEEAAAQALLVQRDNDPANTATVFEVVPKNDDGLPLHGETVFVDLSALNED